MALVTVLMSTPAACMRSGLAARAAPMSLGSETHAPWFDIRRCRPLYALKSAIKEPSPASVLSDAKKYKFSLRLRRSTRNSPPTEQI